MARKSRKIEVRFKGWGVPPGMSAADAEKAKARALSEVYELIVGKERLVSLMRVAELTGDTDLKWASAWVSRIVHVRLSNGVSHEARQALVEELRADVLARLKAVQSAKSPTNPRETDPPAPLTRD